MKKIKVSYPFLLGLVFIFCFSVYAGEDEIMLAPEIGGNGPDCSFNTTCGSDVCVTENAKNKLTSAGCVKQCDHVCFMQKML